MTVCHRFQQRAKPANHWWARVTEFKVMLITNVHVKHWPFHSKIYYIIAVISRHVPRFHSRKLIGRDSEMNQVESICRAIFKTILIHTIPIGYGGMVGGAFCGGIFASVKPSQFSGKTKWHFRIYGNHSSFFYFQTYSTFVDPIRMVRYGVNSCCGAS